MSGALASSNLQVLIASRAISILVTRLLILDNGGINQNGGIRFPPLYDSETLLRAYLSTLGYKPRYP